jgi:DNA-binding LacI/PurR family transcriptional regulator
VKDRRATSFDIAELAGVSQSTVSRALRNSALLSEETRRKVREAAARLNYKVDVNARNLRAQCTNTLALLLCADNEASESQINPFFLSMLGSITKASAQHGYDLLISFQHFSNDWSADYEDSKRADGLIFLGYGDYTGYIAKIARLAEQGAHFITWGPVIKGQPGYFLGSDNRAGARAAVAHLIALGHQRIAFLGNKSDAFPEFKERYVGYCEALSAAGLVLDPSLQVDALTAQVQGMQAAHILCERNRPFDAVFAASDLIAIGAMKYFQERGMTVPGDVGVVGFDDIQAAASTNPPLTTVRQDTLQAGAQLVERLIALINGAQVEASLIPTTLQIRKSCGAYAAAEPATPVAQSQATAQESLAGGWLRSLDSARLDARSDVGVEVPNAAV